MNDTSPELNRLQRWMQAVIMHPDGIEAGIASPDAQQQIDVAPDNLEQVISPSKNLTSVERMRIYGNAYFARLMECLGQEFPAVKYAVAEDIFNAFCVGYLQRYPSRSYTLSELAADFPQYLAETRPDRDSGNNQPDFADFLIELATLERTYSEVFDGPGVEGQSLLQVDDLLSIPQQHWPEAKLVGVECLRLMTFNFPVHTYASAVRQALANHGSAEDQLERPQSADAQNPRPVTARAVSPPNPELTYLVITRRDFIVRRVGVSQCEYELLDTVLKGRSVAQAIAHAVEVADLDMDTLGVRIQGWFRQWARAGYFREVRVQSGFSG